MRLVWVVIPLVFFGIVGVQESFAEEQIGLWFVGKDLNFHDYYKYKICSYDDENICDPFELFLWVKSDLPDKWVFEVLINDDNKKIRGQIDLDKNSLTMMTNDEIRTYLNPIRDFFNSYNIASIDNPQSFNHTNWKNIFSGNREINLQLSDLHIYNNTDQVYSLQSIDGILFTNEPILISEKIPFPIKANYTIFDQDFLRFDDKQTCNDGGVLVQKINEKSNQCINFATAYQWAELGLILMPNVGFELLESEKHSGFIPGFLLYYPSIDDDVKLTYGSRVLFVGEKNDTPFPLPPEGTAIGMGLFATHTANNIAVRAEYLDSDGNLKKMHIPLSNGEYRVWDFEVRNFTKVWGTAHSSYGGLINLQYFQPKDVLYHGETPKVNAGNDQIITNQEFVTLDGSKTIHPLGNNMTYHWSIPHSPIKLNTTSFNSSIVTFPTSEIKTPGSVTFRLNVWDERFRNLRSADEVVILFDFSPLLQVKKGVDPKNVECKEGLILIHSWDKESSETIPYCVKPETANQWNYYPNQPHYLNFS